MGLNASDVACTTRCPMARSVTSPKAGNSVTGTALWGLLVCALAILLGAGCAPDVHLRDPQTGKQGICEGGFRAQGLGGILDGSARRVQMRCVDNYQLQGYVRVPG